MQWQKEPQGLTEGLAWSQMVSVAVAAEAPAGSLAEVLVGQTQTLPENAHRQASEPPVDERPACPEYGEIS